MLYCSLCRKASLCTLVNGFCFGRKGRMRGRLGVTHRLMCTWQLLGLALILSPFSGLISDREGCFGSELVFAI